MLLSTYAQAPQEPAGDPTPGLALLQQAQALAQSFDRAAQTHQTVPLASHRGCTQANASILNPHEAPLQALHESVKGTVSPRWPQAQGELPHSSDPVLQAQARAGLPSRSQLRNKASESSALQVATLQAASLRKGTEYP